MSQTKRILISIPDTLLQEVDAYAKSEKAGRSKVIQKAIAYYLKGRKKTALREQMKTGYREMADINLSLAEIYFPEENSLSDCPIGSLAESDKKWL